MVESFDQGGEIVDDLPPAFRAADWKLSSVGCLAGNGQYQRCFKPLPVGQTQHAHECCNGVAPGANIELQPDSEFPRCPAFERERAALAMLSTMNGEQVVELDVKSMHIVLVVRFN